MNKWFQTQTHHYASWLHPSTSCRSMINIVLVVIGIVWISCWSDHYLIQGKLHFGFQRVVSTSAMYSLACESVRKKYQQVLAEKSNNVNNSEVSTEGC